MNHQQLRVLRLSPHLIGFYDGRTRGQRYALESNWVDDNVLLRGICTYALVDGADAIVFDPHVTVAHAAAVRRELDRLGVRRIIVVLSHWHLDHIAGTEAFADCETIASRLTYDVLVSRRAEIEAGATADGPPAISPLILPTTVFDGQVQVVAGGLVADLLQLDIHSADGTALHVADEGLLLVGDMLEDTVTYVSEPERLSVNLVELDRLRKLKAEHIYPAHGSEKVIASTGYGDGLIQATQQYIRDLLRVPTQPALADLDLQTFVADSIDAGWIAYFEPYEDVHRSNLSEVLGAQQTSATPSEQT